MLNKQKVIGIIIVIIMLIAMYLFGYQMNICISNERYWYHVVNCVVIGSIWLIGYIKLLSMI